MKKSIFLANCIYFDFKLQKVQNNAGLGDFLDKFWRYPKLRCIFWFKKKAVIGNTVWSQGGKCVSYHGQRQYLAQGFQTKYSALPRPPHSTGKKRGKTRHFMLYLNTLIMLRSWPKFFLDVIQSFMNSFFEKNLGLVTQKTLF